MNTRQAKKIIGCQWTNCLPYWWDRDFSTLYGSIKDHRVLKAMKIIDRKDRPKP